MANSAQQQPGRTKAASLAPAGALIYQDFVGSDKTIWLLAGGALLVYFLFLRKK